MRDPRVPLKLVAGGLYAIPPPSGGQPEPTYVASGEPPAGLALMQRDTLITSVVKVERNGQTPVQDYLAVEEPLAINVSGTILSITMRTPGHDIDLVMGFLITEGIVESPDQIVSLSHENGGSAARAAAGNTIRAEFVPGFEVDEERLRRNFASMGGCGVCGKTSLAALEPSPSRRPGPRSPVFDAALIHSLPNVLRNSQRVFDRTGGLHAAALFSPTGQLLGIREDIGRHNALDKLLGMALRDPRSPMEESLVLISSRAGFEIVQKAVMVGLPLLAAVGAPSTLAVETARRFGLTLLGFVRDERFNIYSGAERIRV
jgi:FdhD protein